MNIKQLLSTLSSLEDEILQLRRIVHEQSLELRGYRLIERLISSPESNGMCMDVLYGLREVKQKLNIKLEAELLKDKQECDLNQPYGLDPIN